MSAKRPVIGVTIDSDDKDRYQSFMNYAAAVEKAGGLPLLLPYKTDHSLVPQYVDLLDGILFTGGNDLDPALYGEAGFHPKTVPIDPARQSFELALMKEVEKRRMPTLGICLGSQVMNVYRGGSLVQFLPEQDRPNALEHRSASRENPTRHQIKVDTKSQLGGAIGKSDVSANSFHKQGIKTLGKGLRVIATAADGVIEAFEDPTFPLFAAVQWHPERLTNEPEHLAPFKLLVQKSTKK